MSDNKFMAEGNGTDNTQPMDKLLLRAQVLQQDALEQNQKAIARHEAWIAEAKERGKRVDERIETLVS
jgi:hypothetical protein